ncbi:MAG TPA: ABC transporter substrate-binding protein [Stellaceae bacterium]|nr:ABC transporter substrate-binding protein [Stellaceae bacterium]
MRRSARTFLAAAIMLGAACGLRQPASAADTVNFGTDWKAEAEHGGYYQALATGIYQRYGLDVKLKPGGPQVNHAQLLAAGVLDFNIASNSFAVLNYVQQQIPMVAVAAIFQKDPSVLIAHPGQGDDSLAALKGKPIMISSDTRVTSWLFLKQKFGYTDDQIRPYAFSAAPFLADATAIQQGYLTSEPFTIEHAGVKPVVLLLADAGYSSYGGLIETSQKLAHDKPDLVRRFVNASIEGWYSYLFGDPAPGDALIKRDNSEMTDALLAYGRDKMKEYGIIASGDAAQRGIGAMSEARWRDFFETMAKAKLYPADMDFRRAFTLQFVNQKVGMRP